MRMQPDATSANDDTTKIANREERCALALDRPALAPFACFPIMDTASVEVRAQKGKVEDDLPQFSHKRKGETDEETAAMQHVKRGKSVQEEAEAAQKQGPATLEVRRVAFFFRPKVDKGEVGSLSDVQRFYMLLSPSHKAAKSRLCIIGKKRLPSVRRHEVRSQKACTCIACSTATLPCWSLQRFFGFVEAIAEDDKELLEKLGPAQYETKTRGGHAVTVPSTQQLFAMLLWSSQAPSRPWARRGAGHLCRAGPEDPHDPCIQVRLSSTESRPTPARPTNALHSICWQAGDPQPTG